MPVQLSLRLVVRRKHAFKTSETLLKQKNGKSDGENKQTNKQTKKERTTGKQKLKKICCVLTVWFMVFIFGIIIIAVLLSEIVSGQPRPNIWESRTCLGDKFPNSLRRHFFCFIWPARALSTSGCWLVDWITLSNRSDRFTAFCNRSH